MDAAAPEAAEPQEKAEPQAEPRRRWRVKIPTSVVVTLLGIALTAWLLPAFTRQWDDRQRAAEVKAAISSQIAAATAQALIRSRQLARTWEQPSRKQRVLKHRLSDLWLSDSIKIETHVRAYFNSEEIVGRLHAYNGTMESLFLVAAYPRAINVYGRAGMYAENLGLSRQRLENAMDDVTHVAPDVWFETLIQAVLAKENDLTAAVSHAHVVGYSTTTRDLIHDLLPF
jgi:hypothetical protein